MLRPLVDSPQSGTFGFLPLRHLVAEPLAVLLGECFQIVNVRLSETANLRRCTANGFWDIGHELGDPEGHDLGVPALPRESPQEYLQTLAVVANLVQDKHHFSSVPAKGDCRLNLIRPVLIGVTLHEYRDTELIRGEECGIFRKLGRCHLISDVSVVTDGIEIDDSLGAFGESLRLRGLTATRYAQHENNVRGAVSAPVSVLHLLSKRTGETMEDCGLGSAIAPAGESLFSAGFGAENSSLTRRNRLRITSTSVAGPDTHRVVHRRTVLRRTMGRNADPSRSRSSSVRGSSVP